MKPFGPCIAACAMFPLLAFAQSSVTIYGIADTGVEYVNKQPTAGAHVTRVVSGAESGSRLGFRGTEDLGGGLRAFFRLESGINFDNGTYAQGGLPFGREAQVGIAGSWGEIALGRQAPALNVYAVAFDPLGRPSRYSSPMMDPFYSGRVDNVVSYSRTSGGTRVMALYGLGEVTGSSRAGRYIGAYGSTVLGNFTLGAAYDDQAGATAALANDSVTRTSVAALYKLDSTTLSVGYTDRRNKLAAAPSRVAQYWVGAKAQLSSQWYLAAAYYVSDLKSSPNKSQSLSVLATYALSKRTDIYLHASTAHNAGTANMGVNGFGTAINGGSQQGVTVGMRHLF